MTRDSVFIPDHPSQFSTEWLAAKLNQPAEKLNGFTFEPVGTGQVGDSYRLHLDWNMAGDLPPSLVVKCPAADPTQRLSADILDMGAAFIAGYEKYTEARETPLVLQHGDFRVDNMLFHGQDRPFILDWQTLSAGQPMVDVAYCISTSFADAESRRAHEQNLVQAYLQALGPVAAGYDFDAAWQDYRRAAFAGFLVALFSAMVVERTERGDEMFAVMAERSGWQVLDLDSLAAL
ncbi:MAG: DUF1679 domain-containing protein [Alphaproteobacteria bacterium]|nr:DUF1679 domain-containing protein [Alphaproteobacteria bacterium]